MRKLFGYILSPIFYLLFGIIITVFANDARYDRDPASSDYRDDFFTMEPVWRWRVNQPAEYTVGDRGLFLTASRANDGIGSLCVQTCRHLIINRRDGLHQQRTDSVIRS